MHVVFCVVVPNNKYGILKFFISFSHACHSNFVDVLKSLLLTKMRSVVSNHCKIFEFDFFPVAFLVNDYSSIIVSNQFNGFLIKIDYDNYENEMNIDRYAN